MCDIPMQYDKTRESNYWCEQEGKIVYKCNNESQCHGDFDCDNDCDGTDAAKFKEDFGRSGFNNPCPACTQGNWCIYP